MPSSSAPTRDQLSAIAEIKRDMESPQPMDRLLCGDVGYGKTEVVMRATFKALGDGKQVVILAPTTVLVFQHFETFKRRFQPFPVRVEMFSRFRSPKELKASVADLAEGKIDVAIGTHRLLSEDIQFRDLGLVIVDEEQRFGVKHKERLKHLKKAVDVVSMSATPIPRTLHMSLLGLRDMSVIETPPKDRLAIHTVVAPYQPELIRQALELELARGGQVYFLHNRVDSIWTRAHSIQELVPNARIGVGHGQMGEAELEKTMLQFMRREFDILVCTTIIENGLDIPLANTIVIENAERYGLSELYQLRGRVGRSNRRAYAYLLVQPDTELTEIARKRLAALKEFSDLGAGFKIAALDLELRGAGQSAGRRAAWADQLRGLRHLRTPAGRDRPRTEGRRGGAGDPLLAESEPGHTHPARVHRRRKPASARLPPDRQRHRRRRPRPCRKGTGGSIWPSPGASPQPRALLRA